MTIVKSGTLRELTSIYTRASGHVGKIEKGHDFDMQSLTDGRDGRSPN